MKKTPKGTSVGVTDPYEHAGVCDYVTGDGKCRYAFDHPQHDSEFAAERRADDFRCPVAADDWEWRDCPHYRYRASKEACERCGIEERRDAHSDDRPLLEEHHLAYADEGSESGEHAPDSEEDASHEITIYLCRWCHAKIHKSWASIADDASPDPEAIAAREGRRTKEQAELGFETAAERFDDDH